MVDDPAEVPVPIAVGVRERARVDLVDDGVAEPVHARHRRRPRLHRHPAVACALMPPPPSYGSGNVSGSGCDRLKLSSGSSGRSVSKYALNNSRNVFTGLIDG